MSNMLRMKACVCLAYMHKMHRAWSVIYDVFFGVPEVTAVKYANGEYKYKGCVEGESP